MKRNKKIRIIAITLILITICYISCGTSSVSSSDVHDSPETISEINTTPENNVTNIDTQTSEVQITIIKDGWDITDLDTARNVDYLSDLEKEVILEMNMVRSDPKKYAEMFINPNQGATARECYNELIRSDSRPILMPKRGLSLAARDHVTNTGPRGIVGHTGADGSSMSQRINRYGTWRGSISENCSYGHNTARGIMVQLLTSSGHRRNIMNRNSRYTGVAAGTHSRYNYMCVQKFANDFTDK